MKRGEDVADQLTSRADLENLLGDSCRSDS